MLLKIYPAGGAGGDSPGGDAPLPSSISSSSLLQAEVLDLDEDEDDLEVFSKVRAVRRRVQQSKRHSKSGRNIWVYRKEKGIPCIPLVQAR